MTTLIQYWTREDYQSFTRTLFKDVREQSCLSQIDLSEKMGFSSNVIYKMETARNRILWEDLISTFKIASIDIEYLFIKYFNYDGNILDLEKLFLCLFKDITVNQLASVLDTNAKSLKRSITQTNSLEAYVVFLLIGRHFPRFIEFVVDILNGKVPDDILFEYKKRKQFRGLIPYYPWLEVLRLYFRENTVRELKLRTSRK